MKQYIILKANKILYKSIKKMCEMAAIHRNAIRRNVQKLSEIFDNGRRRFSLPFPKSRPALSRVLSIPRPVHRRTPCSDLWHRRLLFLAYPVEFHADFPDSTNYGFDNVNKCQANVAGVDRLQDMQVQQ